MSEQPQSAARSSLGFAGAALANFIFMLGLNAHASWRPLLDGVVTESFREVLWALNLGFVVQIFGNLVLSVVSPRPLRCFVDLVFASTAFIGALAFYRVFPLDLSRFGQHLPLLVRGLFFVGVVATSLAILVNLFRFFASGGPRPEPARRQY